MDYTFPVLFSFVFDTSVAARDVTLGKKIHNTETNTFDIKVFSCCMLIFTNMANMQNFEGISDDLKNVRTIVAVTKLQLSRSQQNRTT
jgi:hypothetical protein